VADDPNLQLVTLLRTAENKYWRGGIDDPEELAGGFPKTREELFKYRAIILGSVEASFFTHDQLRMIAEFVSERGGGLLMLGGRNAFAEGGYAGTPLADVIPVELDASLSRSAAGTAGAQSGPRDAGENDYFVELAPELTPAGRSHSATQIAPTAALSAARWKELPAVSTVNRLGRLKPGATALLTGKAVEGRGSHYLLAFQRFGAGKSVVLPIQDSWIWQMHALMSVEDQTHETFWRQMMRWLVSGVPGTVTLAASADRVAPKVPVVLRADVHDANYLRVNNAKVTASIVAPGAAPRDVPMEWTVDRDGEYRASFIPDVAGLYEVRVDARTADTVVASDTVFVQAAELNTEYFSAEMRAAGLKRIADETGGQYYTEETLAKLPEDLTFTKSGATVLQQMDLWDMPAIFFLLVALVSTEWAYRKARGLA
jgi:uncharacterized membrane protein